MGFCSFKRVSLILAAVAALLFVSVTLRPAHTSAAFNPQINFQGKLTNPDGTNVADSTYSIRFRIYTSTAPTDATNTCAANSCKWEETQGSVATVDGIFQVALGSSTALPGSVDFNSTPLYLGIKVGADAEMTPRIVLTAAPFAFNADKLDGIDSTGFLQVAPGSAQADATTSSSVFLNKTGSSGSILQLQKSGADVFTVGNSGATTIGAALTIQSAAYTTNLATINDGITSAVPTIPGGYLPAFTVRNSQTSSSRPLFFGYDDNTGTGWAGYLTAGACGSFTTMCLDLGSGTTTFTALENSTTTLKIGGGDDGNFTDVTFLNTGITTIAGTKLQVGSATPDGTGVLFVLDIKNTAGDPTGQSGATYYNSALNERRCYDDSTWQNCQGTPVVRERRTGNLQIVGTTATVMTSLGLALPTVNGTATASLQAESDYINWASTATTNAVAGGTPAAFTATQPRYRPKLTARIRVDPAAITTTRYWISLNSVALTGTAPVTTAAASAISYVGLGFTNALSANWICGSGDGTNHSGTDTGVAVVAGHYYDVNIDYSASGTLMCAISDNGAGYTVTTKTTNLPTTVVSLGVNFTVTTLANIARNISASYVSLEQN